MSNKKLYLYFDGGCKPNPGKGYGSYEIQDEGGKTINRQIRRKLGGGLTNNLAEYLAMILGLKYLRDNKNIYFPNEIELYIYTDSSLVLNQMNGLWDVKDYSIKYYYNQAKELLVNYNKWEINWRPRDENVHRFGH